MRGYIKTIRPDNKIDVALQIQGYQSIEPNADKILQELKASRGFLRLTDNSHPDDIKTVLKMSKKTFKMTIGGLFKKRIILIEESGIKLIPWFFSIGNIMARIKVDLHDIYNNSKAIDSALQNAFDDAIEKKIREVEIIPGKGSGQLRKKVERFLQQPHIKAKYHRIENDSKNFGRLFVYFKFWLKLKILYQYYLLVFF